MTDVFHQRWKEGCSTLLHKQLGFSNVYEDLLDESILSGTMGLYATGHYITTLFMNDAQIAAAPDPRARVMELVTRVPKAGGAIIEMETGHNYRDRRFVPRPEIRCKPTVREFAVLDMVVDGAVVVPQEVPQSVMFPSYAPQYFKRTSPDGAPMGAAFGIPLRALRASENTPLESQIVKEIIGEEAAAASAVMAGEKNMTLVVQWPTLPLAPRNLPQTPQTTADLIWDLYQFIKRIAMIPDHYYGGQKRWMLGVDKAGERNLVLDDLVLAGVIEIAENSWMPLLYTVQRN